MDSGDGAGCMVIMVAGPILVMFAWSVWKNGGGDYGDDDGGE